MRTTASVGWASFGSGTVSTRTSPAPYMTAALIFWISLSVRGLDLAWPRLAGQFRRARAGGGCRSGAGARDIGGRAPAAARFRRHQQHQDGDQGGGQDEAADGE